MAGAYEALYAALYGAAGTPASGPDPELPEPEVADAEAAAVTLTDSAQDILDRLPEGWVDTDPILPTLVSALAVALDELDGVAADGADGSPGWVKLVDPSRAVSVEQVRWAGQLVGVDVPRLFTFAEAVAMVTERNRWQRGTPAAIQAAIRPYLIAGTGDALLVERDGSAYALSIYVRDEQVGGSRYYKVKSSHPDYDDVEAQHATYDELTADETGAEAAALAAVPAGIVASFSVVPDFTYANFSGGEIWDDYDDVEASLASYDALTFYDPS